MKFIGSLCLILILVTLAGHFSARLNLPVVMGELLVGIIFGPSLLNWVQSSNLIHIFSEIGVIILMFIAGLNSNLNLLKKFVKSSTIIAISGMIIPIITAFLTGIFFNFTNFESLFIGIIFSATSVSISAEVLKEMNSIDSKEGATILGAAIVDDLLSVFLLSFVSGSYGNTERSINSLSVIWLQIAYLIFLFIFSFWIVPKLMRLSNKLLVPVSETLMALIICLGLSYLAELVGLSSIIGAFFSGISISQTQYKNIISKRMESIGYTTFIPAFFVNIGLKMTLTGIFKDWIFFVVLTLGSIISKLIGSGLGAKLSGFTWTSSLMIGSGMVSRGEMALIVAQIGRQTHLLSRDSYSNIVGAIIVTTLVAPLMLKFSINLVKSDNY
ncbi:MAG: cation:proton antiporter [Bombilactobacillus mellifer]|nr:cation:proton antiporter [Bombilactobacillus mellifer]